MAELENIRGAYLNAQQVVELLTYDHWVDCCNCYDDEDQPKVMAYLQDETIDETERDALVARADVVEPLVRVACRGDRCRKVYSYEVERLWCTSCHGCFACRAVEMLASQLKAEASTPPQQGDAPQ